MHDGPLPVLIIPLSLLGRSLLAGAALSIFGSGAAIGTLHIRNHLITDRRASQLAVISAVLGLVSLGAAVVVG